MVRERKISPAKQFRAVSLNRGMGKKLKPKTKNTKQWRTPFAFSYNKFCRNSIKFTHQYLMKSKHSFISILYIDVKTFQKSTCDKSQNKFRLSMKGVASQILFERITEQLRPWQRQGFKTKYRIAVGVASQIIFERITEQLRPWQRQGFKTKYRIAVATRTNVT